MADLIVEDGTGKVDAESFCSVDFADTYHANRNVAEADWFGLDPPVKEGLLRKATDYIQQQYSDRWRGTRRTYAQALDWPRAYVLRSEANIFDGPTSSNYYWWNENEVPTPLKNACAVLAFKAQTAELSPDLDRRTTEETVGPITIKYADGSQEREAVEFPEIDAMLRRLLDDDDGITSDAVRG